MERPEYRLERLLGALSLALICLITLANVVVRYFTDFSFAFTEEFSIALMVILTFVGSAAAFAAGRHVRITFLVERLPRRLRLACEALAQAATVGLFTALTVLGAQMAFDEYRFEVTSPGLGLPQWWYSVWLPLLALLIAVRVLGAAWRYWKGARR